MSKVLSSLSVQLNAGVSGFASQMNGAVGTVQSAVGKMASIGGSIGTGILQGIGQGIVGGIGKVAGLIADGLGKGWTLAADMEETAVSFEVMLGSAKNAQIVLSQLQKFGASTPFEFPELASASKKLLAFGVSADQLLPSLQRIGDIAKGLQIPLEDLSDLYGKAKVQGTLMAEDLNQLMGRGIPVMKEFAKQLGVSEGEVKKLASEGKVTFPMLEKAFKDMTGTGGQFNGMMDKQSQTLNGLLSTLSDNVGQALMRVTQSMLTAFNIKGGITALSDMIGSATDYVVGYLTTAVQLGIKLGQMVWGFIQGVWAKVLPTLVNIGEGIAFAWSASYDSIVAYGMAIYNFLSTIWTTTYNIVVPIVQAIWEGITAAFTWGLNALGITTAAGLDGQQGMWGKFIAFMNWVRTGVTYALNAISFGVENWKRLGEFALLSYALSVVRFANQVIYFFADAIPYALGYLSRNWLQVFGTMANFTETIFKNLFGNIAKIITNIPALLKGQLSLSDLWTPLTDGFRDVLTESFKLPERKIGELEGNLSANVNRLGAELSQDFAGYMKGKELEAKTAADTLKNGAADILKQFADAPEKMKAPDMSGMKLDLKPEVAGPDKKADDKAKKAEKQTNKAIEVGSAEAMRLAFGGSTKVKDAGKEMVKKQGETNGLLGSVIDAINKAATFKPKVVSI